MACETAQSNGAAVHDLSGSLLQDPTSLCDFETVPSNEYKTLNIIISTGQSTELLGRNVSNHILPSKFAIAVFVLISVGCVIRSEYDGCTFASRFQFANQ